MNLLSSRFHSLSQGSCSFFNSLTCLLKAGSVLGIVANLMDKSLDYNSFPSSFPSHTCVKKSLDLFLNWGRLSFSVRSA